MSNYSNLVQLASKFKVFAASGQGDRDTDWKTFDADLWKFLYEYGNGDIPAPERIEEITHLWAISPDGYSSVSLAFLAQLENGDWATCVAYADTTGFGCEEQVDWRINSTRDDAIRFGLDKESRVHLGL